MSGRFHGRPPASANVRERPRTSANVRERPRTSANIREHPRTPARQLAGAPSSPSSLPTPSYRPVTAKLPPRSRHVFPPSFPQQPPTSPQLRLSFLPVTAKQTPNSSLLALVTSELHTFFCHPVSAKFLSVAEQLVTATARLPPSCRQIAAATLTPASPEPAPEPVSPSATLAAEPQNTESPDSRQAYERHSLPYCAIRRLG